MSTKTPAIEISRVVDKDLPGLIELYKQLNPNAPSLENMQQALARNQDNPQQLALAARVDGQIVGSLMIVTCEMLFGQCKSFMVIEDVVVDSQHRRTGIGRALMQHAEEHALANNCSYIMLTTEADRPDAQRFYRSMGYQSEKYCAFQKRL